MPNNEADSTERPAGNTAKLPLFQNAERKLPEGGFTPVARFTPLDSPPWRTFPSDAVLEREPPPLTEKESERGRRLVVGEDVRRAVDVAIALRRPLLLTGNPGTGKSGIAYAIAYDLGLGTVLRWNITSRATLKDGLYAYDVLDRLNEASLNRTGKIPPVDAFIRLGPLGTSLLPTNKPRVLLIDELDKSDIDLPNDLLNIFEEGYFDIPELQRDGDSGSEDGEGATKGKDAPPRVRPADQKDKRDRVEVPGGKVSCKEFPIVVLTSNNEREFSPAFLRRCIRQHIPDPDTNRLRAIAEMHLGKHMGQIVDDCLKVMADAKTDLIATDQLLNALFLLKPGGAGAEVDESEKQVLRDLILTPLAKAAG